MAIPPGNQLFNYDASGNAMFTIASGGVSKAIANMTALQALSASALTDGQFFMLQTDGSLWRYAAASVLTTDTSGPFLVATATTAGAGAFLRMSSELMLVLPETFATADAAILWTVPVGFVVQPGVGFHHVTTSWTGGTSSAIGGSSSAGGATTKGDLIGGASGDVAAGLLSTGTYAKGTVGAKVGNPITVLVGGDTIRFDRITSVFTAGTGTANYPIKVLVAPAA